MRPHIAIAVSLCAVVCAAEAIARHTGAGTVTLPRSFEPGAQVVLSEDSWHSLIGQMSVSAWEPKVNPTKSRGNEALFAKVAPAVVVVRTAMGHGTGFFISADGFVLTNTHVVEDGAGFDAKRQASVVSVHTGRLRETGSMELLPDAVPAYIYKVDPQRDLALLKLAEMPKGSSAVPYIPLSEQPPRPGQNCSVVGNPAAGLLWTYRACQISGLGQSPDDLVDVIMPRLAFAGRIPKEIEDEVNDLPKRAIVLTSCGINPGDSGGPVVNDNGELLAVTFAVPADPARAKFSYHIGLNEVRAFLAEVPAHPTLMLPDPWHIGPRVEIVDLLHQGRAQTLIAGTQRPEQIMFDLTGRTPKKLLDGRDTAALVKGHQFHVDVALHFSPVQDIAFYDTDGDGTLDLILIDRDKDRVANQELQRDPDGKWSVQERAHVKWIDGSNLKDAKLAARFMKLVSLLKQQ
jgi:S1-C subfamily serine protease